MGPVEKKDSRFYVKLMFAFSWVWGIVLATTLFYSIYLVKHEANLQAIVCCVISALILYGTAELFFKQMEKSLSIGPNKPVVE